MVSRAGYLSISTRMLSNILLCDCKLNAGKSNTKNKSSDFIYLIYMVERLPHEQLVMQNNWPLSTTGILFFNDFQFRKIIFFNDTKLLNP